MKGSEAKGEGQTIAKNGGRVGKVGDNILKATTAREAKTNNPQKTIENFTKGSQ